MTFMWLRCDWAPKFCLIRFKNISSRAGLVHRIICQVGTPIGNCISHMNTSKEVLLRPMSNHWFVSATSMIPVSFDFFFGCETTWLWTLLTTLFGDYHGKQAPQILWRILAAEAIAVFAMGIYLLFFFTCNIMWGKYQLTMSLLPVYEKRVFNSMKLNVGQLGV